MTATGPECAVAPSFPLSGTIRYGIKQELATVCLSSSYGRHGKSPGGTFRVSTVTGVLLGLACSSAVAMQETTSFVDTLKSRKSLNGQNHVKQSNINNQSTLNQSVKLYCVFYSNLPPSSFPCCRPPNYQRPPTQNGHRLLSVSWHCMAKGPFGMPRFHPNALNCQRLSWHYSTQLSARY